MFDSIGETVVIIRKGYRIGNFQNLGTSVPHGNAETAFPKHGDVVVHIAD